jgi:hypothetical protein
MRISQEHHSCGQYTVEHLHFAEYTCDNMVKERQMLHERSLSRFRCQTMPMPKTAIPTCADDWELRNKRLGRATDALLVENVKLLLAAP